MRTASIPIFPKAQHVFGSVSPGLPVPRMPLSLDELKKWGPDPERLNLEGLNRSLNTARWELHVNTLRSLNKAMGGGGAVQ